jgi:hypothetical protein
MVPITIVTFSNIYLFILFQIHLSALLHPLRFSDVTAQLSLNATAKAQLSGAEAFQTSSLGHSDGFRPA